MTRRKKICLLLGFNLFLLCSALLAAEGILWYLQREEGWQVKGFIAPHPQLGYHLEPTKEGVVPEFGIKTPDFQQTKPPGVFRVLLIGDSVSWSESEKVFSNLVRSKLPEQVELINAAVPGYTVYQERLMLERLMPTKPDLILLQYCINDHHRFLHELSSDGLWLYTQEARAVLAPTDNSFLAWATRKSRLVRVIRVRLLKKRSDSVKWNEGFEVKPAWMDQGWELYSEQFRAMLDLAGETPVVLLVFPMRSQYETEDADAFLPQQRLAELSAAAEVPMIDFTDILSSAPGEFFADNFHLNSEGHRVVSEHLLKALDEKDLLPRGVSAP